MNDQIKNIVKIRDAFSYSINGLKVLLNERAFKQELIIGIILIFIEFFRNTSIFMLLYLFSSYVLILIFESVNSSIEIAINRISLEDNILSKKAKDVGSALVFIAILHFSIIWIVSFFL